MSALLQYQGVKSSIKVVKLPNPFSIAEIKRKSIKPLALVWSVALLLVVLSYGADLVSWFFSLYIPLYFFRLSFRLISAALVTAYGIYNRVEIRAFVHKTITTMTEKQRFFKQLDETEGLAKLKLLQEHSEKKKRERKAREEAERTL